MTAPSSAWCRSARRCGRRWHRRPADPTLTAATGNGAAIGGLEVVAESCWFAARPSGTEDVHKVYAETFQGPDYLERVLEEARAIVAAVLWLASRCWRTTGRSAPPLLGASAGAVLAALGLMLAEWWARQRQRSTTPDPR